MTVDVAGDEVGKRFAAGREGLGHEGRWCWCHFGLLAKEFRSVYFDLVCDGGSLKLVD